MKPLLCKIYQSTFRLNSKLRDEASWGHVCPGWGGELGIPDDWDEKHIRPLLHFYNFHFEPWEEIILDFDPAEYHHWEFFRKYIRRQNFFSNLRTIEFWNQEYNWMPASAKWSLKTEYTVYKIIDEDGKVIDPDPYLKDYYEICSQKLQERMDESEERYSKYQIGFIRHPHTRNEMRQRILPEEEKWLHDHHFRLKTRGDRRYLPTDYDDMFLRLSKSWKDRTKQRKQYHKYKKQKRKSCRGELL